MKIFDSGLIKMKGLFEKVDINTLLMSRHLMNLMGICEHYSLCFVLLHTSDGKDL